MLLDYQNRHFVEIKDEYDLQKEAIKYLKKTDLLFTCLGLPEFLDTDEKRIEATKRGYTVGSPDLVIFTPNQFYNILCVEFKAPSGFGELSKKQIKILQKLEDESKAKVCVLNNFADFVEIIVKYIHNIE